MTIIFDQNECILYTPDKSIFCDVLQDAPFPEGTYEVKVTYCSRYGRTLPQILNVLGENRSVRIFTGLPSYNVITVGKQTESGRFIQQNACLMMIQDYITGQIKSGNEVWMQIK